MTHRRRTYLYFYTDSVGFPRQRDQSADVTWPFLLQDMLARDDESVCLYMRGLGGGRIGDIEAIFQRDIGYFRAQAASTTSFVVFNIGVVDAAPRPFTYLLKVLTRIPRIGAYLWKVTSAALHSRRRRLQQFGSFRLTSPRAFRASFARMAEASRRAGLIPISVDTPLTPLALEERSPGLRESIALYNSIKHSVGAVVHLPMDWVRDEHYLECGHHFNLAGHQILAQRLYGLMRSLPHE